MVDWKEVYGNDTIFKQAKIISCTLYYELEGGEDIPVLITGEVN